jgi:hypothetical protein
MNDFNPGTIRAKLQSAQRNGVVGTDRGLRLGSEHLLGESRKLVPHEEGVLENSGKTSFDDSTHTAAVSFDTPYAAVQHEDLSFQHDDGRQAKYLEQPMHTEAGAIARLVQGEVKREMGL